MAGNNGAMNAPTLHDHGIQSDIRAHVGNGQVDLNRLNALFAEAGEPDDAELPELDVGVIQDDDADTPDAPTNGDGKQKPPGKQKAKKKRKPVDRSHLALTNAQVLRGEEADVVVPLEMSAIVQLLRIKMHDWPRRVDNALFVDDQAHGIACWLSSTAALFGWIARAGQIEWRRGAGCVPREDLFAELQRTARRYVAVETLPHEPAMEGHYYACEDVGPGDGEALRKLLERFAPSTNVDADLIKAAFLTPMWGGPPGARPCFVVTSDDGRGAGKTTLCEMGGHVYGGCLTFDHREDIGKIRTRLLSASALTQRVCLLDNVKTPRFSWGALEAMVTAAAIDGHRMYVGQASRPNSLTWFVTLNGAALSTDMAQRSVIIHVDKPERSATWEEDTLAFINTHRREILADIIGALRAPTVPLAKFTRWASWERDIVQRLPEPAEAQAVIMERQGDVDADGEEAEIIGDFFAEQLANLDYSPDSERVFIPSQTAARWYGWATGQKQVTVGAASRALKQLVTEGRLSRLTENRCNAWGRGFVWVGPLADFATPIAVDLKRRIYERKQDA